MKTAKRFVTAFLAALLTLSLAGCDKEVGGKVDIPTTITGNEDFQKSLHQTDEMSLVETDTGYYVVYGLLYYIEKASMRATILCAKPDCDHTDPEICNAITLADYLLAGRDKIYYVNTIFSTGESEKLIQSVKPDATDRETVQELKFNETSSSQSSYDRAIYHRGYIYYVSDDIVYRVKLGGEKDSAEVIWSPENAGASQSHGGEIEINPNAIRYTLWADDDTLYFMANVQTTDGTYKDVLFQCGLDGSDVREVWVTPGADQVGEWETTGVSVSQWYVTGGYIYFYLSGGDMWRTELATGKLEKLANTHEQTQYGSAIFSDDYMCLLNDYPVAFYGDPTPVPGGMIRSYGDTIFIYGLDGTFVKEISLKDLYDDPNAMAETHLLCCAGNDIFFLTNGRTPTAGSGMVSATTKGGDTNLCHADIETGKVEVIYTLRKGQ